jgi:hypothetical protein
VRKITKKILNEVSKGNAFTQYLQNTCGEQFIGLTSEDMQQISIQIPDSNEAILEAFDIAIFKYLNKRAKENGLYKDQGLLYFIGKSNLTIDHREQNKINSIHDFQSFVVVLACSEWSEELKERIG